MSKDADLGRGNPDRDTHDRIFPGTALPVLGQDAFPLPVFGIVKGRYDLIEGIYQLLAGLLDQGRVHDAKEIITADMADEGVADIESLEVLKVKPFTDFGSPMEIVNSFGSKKNYVQGVRELEFELYKTG